MNQLTVNNICLTIKKRPILQGVSLQLSMGEIVGILGPNGAGKTSLFYSIIGLNHFDSGEIFLNDTNITNYPMYERARMGLNYLPQEASIFRGLSVEDNIKVALENKNKMKISAKIHNNKERINNLLQEFGLMHLRKNDAISLSGGERRRLEIARALALSPKYILLDEPFAGIDPIVVRDIRAIVLDLKKRGIGVLITDHNVRETLKLVDRAYVISQGKVIACGNPNELINNPLVKDNYIGDEMVAELQHAIKTEHNNPTIIREL